MFILSGDSASGNGMAQSVDGHTWTTVVTVPKFWGGGQAIRRFGSTWVAMNSSGDIAISLDDGATWAETDGVVPFDVFALEITLARWYSGGWAGFGDPTNSTVAHSDDHATWVPKALGATLDDVCYAIATNGTILVAGGGAGAGLQDQCLAWSDDDGATWTPATVPGSFGYVYDVKWNGSYFLACGSTHNAHVPPDADAICFARSVDGKTWTNLGMPAPWNSDNNDVVRRLLWDGSKWLACGARPGGIPVVAYSTDDGASWTDVAFHTQGVQGWGLCEGLAFDGTTYVVVGFAGLGPGISWSLDGITWNDATWADGVSFEQVDVASTFGTPFQLIRAVAVGGQKIRAIFTKEPKHESATGLDDALNHANYTFGVTAGDARPLVAVGVLPDLISYPAFGLLNAGEYALDVQVDKSLTVGIDYSVTGNSRIISAAGAALVAPYTVPLSGAAVAPHRRQARTQEALVDFASDPLTGGPVIDDSGDWAPHSGLPATKKRCLRRILTAKNSFAYLPGYGLPVDVKRPMTSARLGETRADVAQQIRQEPDVLACTTSVEMNQQGFLSISVTARTAEDQEVMLAVDAGEEGAVTR